MGVVIGRVLRSAHGHDLRSAFTASLSAFPALNDGDFDADIEMPRRSGGCGRYQSAGSWRRRSLSPRSTPPRHSPEPRRSSRTRCRPRPLRRPFSPIGPWAWAGAASSRSGTRGSRLACPSPYGTITGTAKPHRNRKVERELRHLRALGMAQFAIRRHGLAIAAARHALGDGRSPSSMRWNHLR